MDKVITTALLTMGAVLASVMVINTMLPALGRSGGPVLSSSSAASEQVKTNVVVVAVLTDVPSAEIYAWIKNVGANEIESIDLSDVFLQTSAAFTRMTYDTTSVTNDCSASPASTGQWMFCYEGDETLWNTADTIKVTISVASLPADDYVVQFTTNNGVTAHKTFSI